MGNVLMMRLTIATIAICAAFMPSTISASEAQDMAAGIKCLPAKKIIKMTRKFDKLKPEKRDTVTTVPEMKLTAKGAGKLPERVYFRTGAAEEAFNMDTDGWVTDFERIGTMDKNGELCMQGKHFANKKDEEAGINLSIDFDVLFKNTSGTHTMAELVDGAKDGKSHYKKMFPGPMALMVPKMTHLGVVYLVEDAALASLSPQISATKNGEKITGLLAENFGDMYVVGLEDLQNLGADGLKIEGEKYQLLPIPSIQKMKDLGFAEDDDGEGEGGEVKD